MPRFQPGIVLEGGSIDVNGRGSCLTTEQCLLNANRNPHLSRTEIALYLQDYLGARHTIWLGQGLAGDDTDGHIDDLARFVNATTVVCMLADDPQDENYEVLQENYRRLQTATDQDGQPFRIVPLPMPGSVGTPDGPLPASYANFYIANGVVLVPTYEHPHDRHCPADTARTFAESPRDWCAVYGSGVGHGGDSLRHATTASRRVSGCRNEYQVRTDYETEVYLWQRDIPTV